MAIIEIWQVSVFLVALTLEYVHTNRLNCLLRPIVVGGYSDCFLFPVFAGGCSDCFLLPVVVGGYSDCFLLTFLWVVILIVSSSQFSRVVILNFPSSLFSWVVILIVSSLFLWMVILIVSSFLFLWVVILIVSSSLFLWMVILIVSPSLLSWVVGGYYSDCFLLPVLMEGYFGELHDFLVSIASFFSLQVYTLWWLFTLALNEFQLEQMRVWAWRLAPRVSWNWYYHFWCLWPGIPKVTQGNKFAISLQYHK